MKRSMNSLPPFSNAAERPTIVASCTVCKKVYHTENTYQSHLNSKKHEENERKATPTSQLSVSSKSTPTEPPGRPVAQAAVPSRAESSALPFSSNASGDEKIAAVRCHLSSKHCLFCTHVCPSLDVNLAHMYTAHSFFIPHAEYLIDIDGLISYLGEKIAVANVCIYCSDKGKAFRTVEAVQKHMTDKSHCKIAYYSEDDRLELSPHYNFSTSYPDAKRKRANRKQDDEAVEDDWVVVSEDQDLGHPYGTLDSPMTFVDYELVLPSGVRIRHRSMRRHDAQMSRKGNAKDPASSTPPVRPLPTDRNSVLVPRKGGFGAFGSGTVRARNHGEACEAGRHVREFRDSKRREDFKTRVGFVRNSQKHFRPSINPINQYAMFQ